MGRSQTIPSERAMSRSISHRRHGSIVSLRRTVLRVRLVRSPKYRVHPLALARATPLSLGERWMCPDFTIKHLRAP
jgi:hypothetical protein